MKPRVCSRQTSLCAEVFACAVSFSSSLLWTSTWMRLNLLPLIFWFGYERDRRRLVSVTRASVTFGGWRATARCDSVFLNAPCWEKWLLHLIRSIPLTYTEHEKLLCLKVPQQNRSMLLVSILSDQNEKGSRLMLQIYYTAHLISASRSSRVLFDLLSLTDQVLSFHRPAWPQSYLLALLASFPVWIGLLSCWCYVGGQGSLLSQAWGLCPEPDGGHLQCWRSGWCRVAQALWKAARRPRN